MESNGARSRRPDEQPTAGKPSDLTDVTILNTPRPQATSTVDRKSLLLGKTRRSMPDEQAMKHRQLNFSNSNENYSADESSLGILQNISSCTNLMEDCSLTDLKKRNESKPNYDQERELARKLLKKCIDPSTENTSNLGKENNVNSSNMQRISNVNNCSINSKYTPSIHHSPPQNEKQLIDCDTKSVSTASIIFEPTEIAARSSEYNKSSEKSQSFPIENFNISYNSNIAEMMAQFEDEEFMSGSRAKSQMLADELSWRKNNFESLPIEKKNDKERLELSCFSGIIGANDLTIEDGRVSVGEFFKRKCGGIGHLSVTSDSDRPSLGLNSKSPPRQRNLEALVDLTVTSEVSNTENKDNKNADFTKDQSVMSLSTIAQMLHNMESVTPIKLVDQIMDANKKKKKQTENVNLAGDTYTVIPERSSLPISKNETYSKDISKKNITQNSFSNKLSLDSKNMNGLDNKNFDDLLNIPSISDKKLRDLLGMNKLEPSIEVSKKSRTSTDHQSFQQNFKKTCHDSRVSIPRAECSPVQLPKWKLSEFPNKFDKTDSEKDESSLINDTQQSEYEMTDPTMTKDENDTTSKESTLTDSEFKDQSFDSKKVAIGKKTQELCTCLVGVPTEADFELHNGTDRWILCSLKLHQIQGEKNNIELELPNDSILIEPGKQKSFKIGVRMPHMGKLIIVDFYIHCSDWTTKASWSMKHLMCFVPEIPNVTVLTPSDNDIIDFPMTTEDTSNSIPITFENKNSIDVPVLLQISQNKPPLFSITDCFDDTINSANNQKEFVHFILKPKIPATINVDFRGISLHSFGEKVYKEGLYNTEAKLSASICFKENEEYLIKVLDLKGTVGSYRLDILDSQFPLYLQPRVVRLINIKNAGSIVITATVDIVQSKENQSECRDFFICPNNIILNVGDTLPLQISYKPENNKTDIDRHAMIRIILGNKISFYPVVGEKVIEIDPYTPDNAYQLQRSETPQCLRSISSPTSPHSLVFNGSGTSGRQSPCSTASAATAPIVGTVIPIRATHTSLVWSSIKVGKSDTKQFSIRNTSNSKIKLFATIKAESQSFKFLKERHTLSSSIVLSLQGMESKTLSVVFTPNFTKAIAGRIIFAHYNCVQGKEITGLVKVIQLFGYGGYGKIEISEAVKDTSGQMWLSLGKLNSEGVLFSKVKLHNTGDLTCFVKAKLTPKALHPDVVSSWLIEPTEVLLAPKQVQWISVKFRPTKDDFSVMPQMGIIHVGTLKLTHGDEPTRLRIRRLYKKLKDSDQLQNKMDEQTDEFKEVVYQISKAFPGEVFPQDLKLTGDTVQNLGDLCKGIVQNEIKLTVEIQADETMSMLQDNMEDTQMFYSLYSDNDDMSQYGGESFLPPE